jgi:hypothetical protein
MFGSSLQRNPLFHIPRMSVRTVVYPSYILVGYVSVVWNSVKSLMPANWNACSRSLQLSVSVISLSKSTAVILL